MSNTPKYIRIFNATPDDDYVTKRMAAIKAIEDGFKKLKNLDELMSLGNDLASAFLNEGRLPDSIFGTVEKALSKVSSSFDAEDEVLQMRTCALIGVLEYLSKIQTISAPLQLTTSDVVAASLFSSMSFLKPDTGKPKLDELRVEIIRECERLCGRGSVVARERLQVNGLTTITAGADITTNNKSIIQAINPIIKALITNAALDREEIDILWYILDGKSDTVNLNISELNPAQAAIVKGLEISTLLRRLPSSAHFKIAEHSSTDTSELSVSELLTEIGDKLPVLSGYLSGYTQLETFPNIFPLLNSIKNNKVESSGSDIKRSLTDWTCRSLLEGSLLNFNKFLNDGK